MSTTQNNGGVPSHGPDKGPGSGATPAISTTLRARALPGILANLGGRLLWECLKWGGEQLFG